MVKKISFLPEFIPLIKEGTKTVTRRVKKKNTGVYYFTGGRTGKKEGYIRIVEARELGLFEGFFKTPKTQKAMIDEIRAEGCLDLWEFIEIWNKLAPRRYRWPNPPMDNPIEPKIWRIKFKYIGEDYEQDTMARLLV